MRAALALVLASLLLAGCSSAPEAAHGHVVKSLIASADFPDPADRARVEAAASRLGWTLLGADPFPEGFSLNYRVDGEVVVAQSHPSRANWSISRFYNLTEGADAVHATREEAAAAVTAAWPSVEPGFDAFVRTFEDAGGWSRLRLRHACLCAEV